MCLYLTTVTQRCGCPKDPVTSFTSFPCELRCTGNVGCSTSWSIVTAPGCSSSSSSHSGSSSSSSSNSGSSSSSGSSSDSDSSSTSTLTSYSSKPTSGTETGFCGATSEYPPPGTQPYPTHSRPQTGSGTGLPLPPATSSVVISGGARRRLAPFRFW